MSALEVMPQLLETDSRGRATLPGGRRRYLVSTLANGALVLEPALVISEAEANFRANTEVIARIAAVQREPGIAVRDDYRRQRAAR